MPNWPVVTLEPLPHPAQETLSSVGQSSGQSKGVVSVRGCKQVESVREE